MLILTRNLNQPEIKIGEDIVIKVLSVKGKSVKLGIEAPKDINVVRTELLENGK